MPQLTKPTVVYHADWGSTDKKRWCARAVLGGDGRYTVSAAEPVRPTGSLIGRLRKEAGHDGCAFAGFDFPIGVPKLYAKRAGISEFREWLPKLGSGEWKEFWSVCDEPGEISVHRPFYPNGPYMGRRQAHLLLGHGVESLDQLLRRCERGGNGQKRACCLFWTLGGNQVGKAAIIGWRDVLAPALRNSEFHLTVAVRRRPGFAAEAGERGHCRDVSRRVLPLVLQCSARRQAEQGKQEEVRDIAPPLGWLPQGLARKSPH